jgi:hypothetical protein
MNEQSKTVSVSDIARTWAFGPWQLPRPSMEQVEVPYLQHLREIEKASIKKTHAFGSADYTAAMEILQTGFTTRFFWNSSHFRATLRDPRNIKKFFLHWISMADPEITTGRVDQIWQEMMSKTLADNQKAEKEGREPEVENPFYEVLWEMLNDPNHSTPS